MFFEPFERSKHPKLQLLTTIYNSFCSLELECKKPELRVKNQLELTRLDLATVGDGLLKEEGILGIDIEAVIR